jgi:hypothetical protein
MMFGKPIVTSSGGGIPEVVEDGHNALLAEPGDPVTLARALRAVIESETLRSRLGARSRDLYLERFQIGVVARAMSALFADAIRVHEAQPQQASAAAMLATALDGRAAAAEAERDTWRTRAEAAEARLGQLAGSRSWRLTKPLRAAAGAARRGTIERLRAPGQQR